MTRRRTVFGWLTASSVVLAALAVSYTAPQTQAAGSTTYNVFNSPQSSVGGSEILDMALTANNKYAVVVGVNDAAGELKVRTVTVSTNPQKAATFDALAAFGTGITVPNPAFSSVAVNPVSNYGIATIREEKSPDDPPYTNGGQAVFFNINDDGSMVARPGVAPITLGNKPESIEVAPNGKYAVVADEQDGKLFLIDLRAATPAVTSITMPVPAGAPNMTAQAEEVAVSGNSSRVFVSLQANNTVVVMDINPDTLAHGTPVATLLPGDLYPDGLASTPDGTRVVTANEGITGERPGTMTLLQVNANLSLTRVGADLDLGLTSNPNDNATTKRNAEMVDVWTVGGTLKAFASLENDDRVAAVDVTNTGLVLDEIINLDPTNALPTQRPEGIKIARAAQGNTGFIATANVGTKNVSVITATTQQTLERRGWLPLILK